MCSYEEISYELNFKPFEEIDCDYEEFDDKQRSTLIPPTISTISETSDNKIVNNYYLSSKMASPDFFNINWTVNDFVTMEHVQKISISLLKLFNF